MDREEPGMTEQAPVEKRERYDIPNTGGMQFICNRWVFTGGADFYRVKERGPGDWIVARYYCTGQADGAAYTPKMATEDEAHAMALRLVTPREIKK